MLIGTAETAATGVNQWETGTTVVSRESVWKRDVHTSSFGLGNVTLVPAPATIDGVALVTTNRYGVISQTAGAENGIYVFDGTNLVRAEDYDTGALVEAGVKFYTQAGTANAKKTYRLYSPTTAITVGVTVTLWEEDGGGGGSGVDVEDEGAALGSFTTLNFVGAGVVASNAGGGQANLTIPSSVIVFDSSVPAAGNSYTTLAAAVTAVQAITGDRWLRVIDSGAHVWPAGAFDLFGLHINGASSEYFTAQQRLTFTTGTTFSRVMTSITGFTSLRFTSAAPLYVGTGEDFDLTITLGGSAFDSTNCQVVATAHQFVINDPLNEFVARLALKGVTQLRLAGTGSFLRMESLSTLYLEMHDSAGVSSGPTSYPFSDDGSVNNYCEMRVFGSDASFASPFVVNGVETITDLYHAAYGVNNVSPLFLGRRADDTGQTGFVPGGVGYGGILSTALSNTGVSSAWQTLHPVIGLMACHGRGSIMVSGITGGALFGDGLLSQPLTLAGAVVTSANIGTNIRRIEAIQTTAAVIDDVVGWISEPVVMRGLLSRITIDFRLPLATSERVFIGVSDQGTVALNTSADLVVGANMVGLQFSTSRGDARVQFMVENAGVQVLQGNFVAGLPNATLSYTLEIVFTGQTNAANVGVYLRLMRHTNTSFSDLGSHTFTVAQCPTAATAMRVTASVRALAASARQIATHAVNLSTGA